MAQRYAIVLFFTVFFTGCRAQCRSSPQFLHARSDRSQVLSSPNYPYHYTNNVDCGWKITADWNYVVRLRVTTLDLEYNLNCGYDSLSVYDAGSLQYSHLLAKLCGSRNNVPDIYSTGRYMYIKFRTDGSNTGRGFQLQYTAVTRPVTVTITPRPNCCGAQCSRSPQFLHARSDHSQVLSSPNYPYHYTNNVDCGWKITADWNYVVRLRVTALDLEYNLNCGYDSLSVYDAGSLQYSHRLAKLCGSRNNVPDIYSTGRYMYIKFVTDGSHTGRGFQLQFTAVTRPVTFTPRANRINATPTPYAGFNIAAVIGGFTGGFILLLVIFCVVYKLWFQKATSTVSPLNHTNPVPNVWYSNQIPEQQYVAGQAPHAN